MAEQSPVDGDVVAAVVALVVVAAEEVALVVVVVVAVVVEVVLVVDWLEGLVVDVVAGVVVLVAEVVLVSEVHCSACMSFCSTKFFLVIQPHCLSPFIRGQPHLRLNFLRPLMRISPRHETSHFFTFRSLKKHLVLTLVSSTEKG